MSKELIEKLNVALNGLELSRVKWAEDKVGLERAKAFEYLRLRNDKGEKKYTEKELEALLSTLPGLNALEDTLLQSHNVVKCGENEVELVRALINFALQKD